MLKELPDHFELLSQADRETYSRISAAISAPTNKNKRNKRVDEFREVLEAIILYENHDDYDRWKRCLVCGLYPFDGGIAVNISALKKLILKCKSSINGSLKAIGYPNVTNKSAICEELLNGIPYLRGNQLELRKWTIRYKENVPESMSKDTKDSKCKKGTFYPQNRSFDNITPPSASIEEESKYSLMGLSVGDANSNKSEQNVFQNDFEDESVLFFNLDYSDF